MAATAKVVNVGLNGENVRAVMAVDTNSIADDANWVITLPSDMAGQGWLPVAVMVNAVDNSALNAGARTWTPQDSVGEAGTPVGADLISYVESTGVLTVANRSGGALQNAVITALMVAAPKISAM